MNTNSRKLFRWQPRQKAVPVKETASAPVAAQTAQTAPDAADMSVRAVMTRLAQRSSQTQQIITQLRAQLSTARQSAGRCSDNYTLSSP